jgi:hypothetical protein
MAYSSAGSWHQYNIGSNKWRNFVLSSRATTSSYWYYTPVWTLNNKAVRVSIFPQREHCVDSPNGPMSLVNHKMYTRLPLQTQSGKPVRAGKLTLSAQVHDERSDGHDRPFSRFHCHQLCSIGSFRYWGFPPLLPTSDTIFCLVFLVWYCVIAGCSDYETRPSTFKVSESCLFLWSYVWTLPGLCVLKWFWLYAVVWLSDYLEACVWVFVHLWGKGSCIQDFKVWCYTAFVAQGVRFNRAMVSWIHKTW